MSIEDYCLKLNNYFNEIVIIEDNTFTLNSEFIYKENGFIKSVKKTKLIELKELLINKKTKDLISPEFYDYGLIQKIRKTENKLSFYFYPKNLFQKLFKKRSELYNYLNSINNEEYFIITTSDISKKIKRKVNIEIKKIDCFDELLNKVLDKQIIIFNRNAKVYINKNIKENEFDHLISIYCGVDLDDFTVINLI
jgi:hypothetical protein